MNALSRWQRKKRVFTVTLLFCYLMGCHKAHNVENDPMMKESKKPPLYEELGLQKYEKVINVSLVRETTPSLRELESQFTNDTLMDNRWTELLEEALGIRVEYKWVEEDVVYHKKLANSLMSGDLADITRVNRQQLRDLERANLIQDLTEVYDLYATELTKQVMEQEIEDPFKLSTIDGSIMGIPILGSAVDTAQYIWIRTDWLELLQLDPPQTMEDVLGISEAFTLSDEIENLHSDRRFGLAISKYLWDPVMSLTGFMAGYQAYPTIWIEDETGLLTYGGIQPEVKDALLVLQEMYMNGQIDEEFFLKDGGKIKEQIINGEVGMLFGEQWTPFLVQESRKIDTKANWKAFPLVSNHGELPSVPIRNESDQFWVVREGFEHPEVLVKMINLFLEKNWGESADYERYYSTPYPIWQLAPIAQAPPLKNYQAFLEIEEARGQESLNQLEGEARAIQRKIEDYLKEGDPDGWGWYLAYGDEGAYSILDSYQANDQLLHNQMNQAPTDLMLEYSPLLYNLQLTAYKNIIMGEPIESFDEFVEDWKRMGGDKMMRELNEK